MQTFLKIYIHEVCILPLQAEHGFYHYWISTRLHCSHGEHHRDAKMLCYPCVMVIPIVPRRDDCRVGLVHASPSDLGILKHHIKNGLLHSLIERGYLYKSVFTLKDGKPVVKVKSGNTVPLAFRTFDTRGVDEEMVTQYCATRPLHSIIRREGAPHFTLTSTDGNGVRNGKYSETRGNHFNVHHHKGGPLHGVHRTFLVTPKVCKMITDSLYYRGSDIECKTWNQCGMLAEDTSGPENQHHGYRLSPIFIHDGHVFQGYHEIENGEEVSSTTYCLSDRRWCSRWVTDVVLQQAAVIYDPITRASIPYNAMYNEHEDIHRVEYLDGTLAAEFNHQSRVFYNPDGTVWASRTMPAGVMSEVGEYVLGDYRKVVHRDLSFELFDSEGRMLVNGEKLLVRPRYYNSTSINLLHATFYGIDGLLLPENEISEAAGKLYPYFAVAECMPDIRFVED